MSTQQDIVKVAIIMDILTSSLSSKLTDTDVRVAKSYSDSETAKRVFSEPIANKLHEVLKIVGGINPNYMERHPEVVGKEIETLVKAVLK
jgi:hypothetical protein